MKTYHNCNDIPKIKNAVVTSGTFDGVHHGHRRILSRLLQIAHESSGEAVVITFWPHPRLVLHPNGGNQIQLLNTFEEKAELLEMAGIHHLVRIPFTKEFSQFTSEEFINQILINKINTRKLVIGYDHKFGRNREGSFEYLKSNASNYQFEIEEIPKQDIDSVGVSSTLIRNALTAGNVEMSNQYLTQPYSLTGHVVEGNKLGRTIGFPTANLQTQHPFKLIPANGVYAVHVHIGQSKHQGMLNIGYRPTIGGTSKTIEVNIFDFDKELYHKDIKVTFVKRIRQEIKFDNLNALAHQLHIDKIKVVETFNG